MPTQPVLRITLSPALLRNVLICCADFSCPEPLPGHSEFDLAKTLKHTLTFTSSCLITVSFPPDSGTKAVLSVQISSCFITSEVAVKFTFPREQNIERPAGTSMLPSTRLLTCSSYNRPSLSFPAQLWFLQASLLQCLLLLLLPCLLT